MVTEQLLIQAAEWQDKYDKLLEAVWAYRDQLDGRYNSLPAAHTAFDETVFLGDVVVSLDAILKELADVDSDSPDAVAEPPVSTEPGPDSEARYIASAE